MSNRSKNVPRKHHTVPKSYLKKFTDNKGMNWVIDDKLRLYSKNPSNLLLKKDFNTITLSDGSESLFIESVYLNKMERHFAFINNTKIAHYQKITIEDKAAISVYIAAQLLRVEARRNATLEFIGKIDEMTSWMMQLSEDEKKHLADNPIIPTDNSRGVPVDEFLKLRNTKSMSTFMSANLPRQVESISKIIFNMNWGFIYTSSEDKFITSDDPVSIVNPQLDKAYGASEHNAPGLGQEHIELTFPLSKNVTLLSGWLIESDLEYLPAQKWMISEFNKRQVRHAKLLVFSSEKDALAKLNYIRVRKRLYGVRNVLSQELDKMIENEIDVLNENNQRYMINYKH